MSVEIKYKGNTIASASTDTTKTLKTSGKYCEADIIVQNTQDGGTVTPEDKTYSVNNQAIEEFVSNVDYTADYSTSSVGIYTAKPYADGGNPKGANVNVKGGTLHQLDNGNEYTKTVAEGETTIYNNTPDTVGAYSVVNDGNVVSYGKLMPSGNVRIIKCDGIVNMRDLGGWAADGGTVRYGKLFRSPALDNATTADISMMSNLLGINSELDMRESGAEGGGSGRFENYLHQPMGNYADIIATDAYKAKSKTAFEFVMNCAIQGKPCVFHCAAGADRTGTMAWVLLGVLGVSQSDCDKEYEITSFSTPTRLRTTYLPALYSAVAALDGDTFAEKCKSVLVECGIEVALINQFRHAMIDGTPTDFEDTADMREEVLTSLKACARMKWSNSTTSGKAPTNNNGWLALATTSGDTWQFTDRESNTCYGIKIPSWATKIVVSTTDASIIKWSFRSYLADGTAVGIADEDNTSGKYAVSNAEIIQISACYSTDGSVTPSWNYDSTKITVKFVGYGGITPSGTIDITENGTYDVTQYAEAVVNVEGGGGGGDIVTPWYTVKTAEVTIGANSVNNPQTAVAYFEGIFGEKNVIAVFLKDQKATYGADELVAIPQALSHTATNVVNASPSLYRMRSNALNAFQGTTGYSCYIYEGAKYAVIYYDTKP